ncbi:uncharacterized protein LOC111469266 [Cucurbita maxima]|uniref:Uncharacterized protein LOC111469266 n=1 Tax=Cucurbita maxima TaxID=3661 RepID=A0A6J1I3D3_CUCMA|nr:uncharacterized protein LOC111469266 [Cucurbita maxima]
MTRSVKIIEICEVAPRLPEESCAAAVPSSLPLTFFDLSLLRFYPTQRLFFYDPSSTCKGSVIEFTSDSVNREASEFHSLVPLLPASHDCVAAIAIQVLSLKT